MIRAAGVLLAVVLLLGLGYLAGRLPDTSKSVREARTLPGDEALDIAWQDFLGAQQAALSSLRTSQFYVDDQERAEAYFAVLQDIQAAISGQPAEQRDVVLLGSLPGPVGTTVQLTPNRMAQRLEQTAQTLRTRSEARLRLAGEAFASPVGGVIEPAPSGLQVAMRHWELDNEEALLIHFPVPSPSRSAASLGNVWAMSLATMSGDSGVGQRLDCAIGTGCRAILSHRNPGLPGWLDTGGHRRGVLVLRWRSDEPAPTVEKTPFSDLDSRQRGPLGRDSLQPESLD